MVSMKRGSSVSSIGDCRFVSGDSFPLKYIVVILGRTLLC